jgi:hypothetical protein
MASSPSTASDSEEGIQKAKNVMSSFTSNTSRAIGSLIPTNALQSLTTRKYTLPDKTVASQVLMYRQLLHTNAKPGLKLSRPYQGTEAQQAVKHMPWWEAGCEESKRMVISYDNLIVRLWLNGAILPYTDLLDSQETMIDEKGLPPVPHDYWVDRLGFQQPDPVTDFRSGGVLSLGMMVHMVESHPDIVARFARDGDVAILPFGLTCINVTDMIAKFIMLAKSVDRMDALLSQKPFWRMFADPNAILVLQELSMSMLCDVVVELGRERKLPQDPNKSNHNSLHGETSGNVTVFDFPTILEITEKRVGNDLLGAGPKTVQELREIHAKLVVKYAQAIEEKERKAGQPPSPPPGTKALENAGDVFAKFKQAASPQFLRVPSDPNEKKKNASSRIMDIVTEVVEFQQPHRSSPKRKQSAKASAKEATPQESAPDLLTGNSFEKKSQEEQEGEWANVSSNDTTGEVTTAVGEFCIGDSEDENEDVDL